MAGSFARENAEFLTPLPVVDHAPTPVNKEGRRAGRSNPASAGEVEPPFHPAAFTVPDAAIAAHEGAGTAQAAMRHSDIKLTTGTDADPKLLDVRQAVERLPNFTPRERARDPRRPTSGCGKCHDCAQTWWPEGAISDSA